jgi:hypothetical protein
MAVLAGYGLQMAKALTPGASSVSAKDFVARLRTTYAAGWGDVSADTPADPAGFDWAALGGAVAKHFRWAPSCAPHMCALVCALCRAHVTQPLTRTRLRQAGPAGHGGEGAQGGAAARQGREGSRAAP